MTQRYRSINRYFINNKLGIFMFTVFLYCDAVEHTNATSANFSSNEEIGTSLHKDLQLERHLNLPERVPMAMDSLKKNPHSPATSLKSRHSRSLHSKTGLLGRMLASRNRARSNMDRQRRMFNGRQIFPSNFFAEKPFRYRVPFPSQVTTTCNYDM